MSRTHAQIERDRRRAAAAEARKALQRQQTRWKHLEAQWATLKEERRIAEKAYSGQPFEQAAGPFAGRTPTETIALARACDEATSFLTDRRAALREEIAQARMAKRMEDLPPIPVVKVRADTTEIDQSVARNLERFASLPLKDKESSAEVHRLTIEYAADFNREKRQAIADELRTVVLAAQKQSRHGQRQTQEAERLAAERDQVLARLWDQVSWCTVAESDELRAEIQTLMTSSDPVPTDLRKRTTAIQASQRTADSQAEAADLAQAVAGAFLGREEFVVAANMVELLTKGEQAYVAASDFDGHGLQIVLDDGELRATSVVEDGHTVDKSFEKKWCDELSQRVYDDLAAEGWSVKNTTSRHQTIQEIAATRLPVPVDTTRRTASGKATVDVTERNLANRQRKADR